MVASSTTSRHLHALRTQRESAGASCRNSLLRLHQALGLSHPWLSTAATCYSEEQMKWYQSHLKTFHDSLTPLVLITNDDVFHHFCDMIFHPAPDRAYAAVGGRNWGLGSAQSDWSTRSHHLKEGYIRHKANDEKLKSPNRDCLSCDSWCLHS